MKTLVSGVLVAVVALGCGDDGDGGVDSANAALTDAAPSDAPGIDAGAGCLEVTATSPDDGATAVAIRPIIVVQFSDSIAPSSAGGAIVLSDAAGPVDATASLSSSDPRLVEVNESAALANQTIYTVTVGTAVEAINGCRLAAPVSFSFTTE